MSGPDPFCQTRTTRPTRPVRRGAALTTLALAGVLVTGGAGGAASDGRGEEHGGPLRSSAAGGPGGAARSGDPARDALRAAREAAAEALADGKSPAEAAERAVSRSGDRWGVVYTPKEYQEFEEALDGRYTGVGVWAAREEDGDLTLTRVRGGSPADEAGLRAGDRMLTVDGRSTAGLPVTEVLARLRGETPGEEPRSAGSTVRIGLERDGRRWTETLRRARLSTDPVTVRRTAGGATLIKVSAFTKGAGGKVRAAASEAPGAGILLDLRGNSGGLVTEAVETASAFLDGGLVATYDLRGEQRALHAERGRSTSRPLVVLVDSGTMSAAELVTGALQDRGRAVVVGSRTFGKGAVQMPAELPGGSVAELTVGHYRTPSGRGVDGEGIVPDLVAGRNAEQRAERVLTGLGGPS
ncbi:S41 family peptidase [Streptomyces chilikensis]|uniref:S41 family peptidase n=1 Tax=Streptomyces chilikensis TaxID=1194079 RepID=A0ABV3EYS0_9ACTN|nr:S41 family peptidase [Streptomyces chilikensis]